MAKACHLIEDILNTDYVDIKADFATSIDLKRMKEYEDITMPDPIARKRLRKKMLDRWENEGGRIDADTTDASIPASEDKGRGRKPSSSSENSTAGAPPSPTKKRKPRK